MFSSFLNFVAGLFTLTMTLSCNHTCDKTEPICPQQLECQIVCEPDGCNCECTCEPDPVEPVTTYYRDIVDGVITPFCLTCHVQGNLGGVSLASYESTMEHVVPYEPDRSDLLGSIRSGKMPLGGAPLSASLQLLVQTWIFEGAHNEPPLP